MVRRGLGCACSKVRPRSGVTASYADRVPRDGRTPSHHRGERAGRRLPGGRADRGGRAGPRGLPHLGRDSNASRRTPGATGHIGDLGDAVAIVNLIADIRPTRIYNLAGKRPSPARGSIRRETADVLGLGPVTDLRGSGATRGRGQPVRVLQASSAEIFGEANEVPQRESTPIRPVTPYGAAKAYAHEMAGIFRARGLHVSAAVLYNHESPRRPASFVARKIALGGRPHLVRPAGRTRARQHRCAPRLGYAPDYVEAMRRIIEQPAADELRRGQR